MIEFDPPFETRRALGVPQIANLHFVLEHFANPLPPDRRFRNRVSHLRKLAHGLVHLTEVKQKHEQLSRGQRAAQHQTRAIPKHQTGATGDDDLDDWRQLGLNIPGLQGFLDALATLAFEPPLFIVLARECFDHANR